jgi:hypothetical protein
MKIIRIGELGGMYFRPHTLDLDSRPHEGHAHQIDHVSLIRRGRFRIDSRHPNGEMESVEVQAGDKVLILAEWFHTFIPLTDDAEWDCIFRAPEDPGDLPGPYHSEKPCPRP